MHTRLLWRGYIPALLIAVLLQFSFPVQAQDDNLWLNSPTQPRKTCGAPWAEYNSAGNQKFHNAIDFCGGYRGSPVVAVADGVVVYADWWQKDYQALNLGHGWTAAVWHPKNRIYTYYTHLQEFTVVVGQEVKRGETVGLEGSSGKTSGPHVHFVTAIMEPQRMISPKNCPQAYCFPNPDDFLGRDVIAQDLGLVTISPTGEVFKPNPGTPVYTGGKDDKLDLSYMTFVETALATSIPAIVTTANTTTIDPLELELDFEMVDYGEDETFEQVNSPETQAQTTINPKINAWEMPLKITLLGLSLFFVFGMIFSKSFRDGAVMVLLVISFLLAVIYFLPMVMP